MVIFYSVFCVFLNKGDWARDLPTHFGYIAIREIGTNANVSPNMVHPGSPPYPKQNIFRRNPRQYGSANLCLDLSLLLSPGTPRLADRHNLAWAHRGVPAGLPGCRRPRWGAAQKRLFYFFLGLAPNSLLGTPLSMSPILTRQTQRLQT